MGIQDLIHYLRQGGVTLALILASSVLALGVGIERLIALWNVGEGARTLSEAIFRHLLRGDVAAARATADRSDAMVADVFRAGLERLDRPLSAVEGAIDRERTQLSLKLRRNLWILGTLGAVTPFVGLFGTVAGIMRSFKDLGVDVQGGGSGGSAAVMIGISEALIATAAGILVAVESVILFNYFQTRVGRLSVELRLMADEFLELLRERSTGALPSSPVASSTPVHTPPPAPPIGVEVALAGDKR
jgi:biopolymer transport protein ExbB